MLNKWIVWNVYFGCKVRISTIHRLRCTNHGSVLHATIHGSHISKGAMYKFVEESLVRSQVQSEDKLQVSGVALASQLVYASHGRAWIKKIIFNYF